MFPPMFVFVYTLTIHLTPKVETHTLQSTSCSKMSNKFALLADADADAANKQLRSKKENIQLIAYVSMRAYLLPYVHSTVQKLLLH